MNTLNYDQQLEKIKNITNIWKVRDLSLIGSIVILKFLALSKLAHLFFMLPNPTDSFYVKLKKIISCVTTNQQSLSIQF